MERRMDRCLGISFGSFFCLFTLFLARWLGGKDMLPQVPRNHWAHGLAKNKAGREPPPPPLAQGQLCASACAPGRSVWHRGQSCLLPPPRAHPARAGTEQPFRDALVLSERRGAFVPLEWERGAAVGPAAEGLTFPYWECRILAQLGQVVEAPLNRDLLEAGLNFTGGGCRAGAGCGWGATPKLCWQPRPLALPVGLPG